MLQITEFQKQVHEAAKAKGWWDSPRESGTMHMLMVSEIAEATEETRKGTPAVYSVDPTTKIIMPNTTEMTINGEVVLLKPEGELIELADAVIRIMDYCGSKGWDLEKAIETKFRYNLTRSHRHGGKAF